MSDIIDEMRRVGAALMVDETIGDKEIMLALRAAADEIERLRAALAELKTLGEQGMKSDYREWLTFHDKVAAVASAALSG